MHADYLHSGRPHSPSDRVASQIIYVCYTSGTCEQPAEVVVHGRGFVAPTDVQCRVDGEVVNGVAVDDTRIACEPMAAAPIVDDPVQGARLSVEVSLDGGTSWTRLTDQAFVQVRLTALPGFPSPPQHCTHMPCAALAHDAPPE